MSLSKIIQDGNFDAVVQALSQNPPINILDEYGYTPLIHATAMNRADIVKLLLKHHAEPDLIDMTGSTALHWAVDNNNQEIAQLLLEQSAAANAYTHNGQPVLFYPLIRKNQTLIKLLVKHGASLEMANDYIQAKLVAHRFELRGNSDIINAAGIFMSIDLEGFYLEFTIEIIRDSVERFINSYVAHRQNIHIPQLKIIVQTLKNAHHLREFKHFNLDPKEHADTIKKLLDRELLLLPVSYKGHAITFIQYHDIFAKCDRGVEKMTTPITISKTNQPDKFDLEFYLHLLYGRLTEKYIKRTLPLELSLEMMDRLPIKHQITGNCSWANVESSVPTMLYILLSQQKNPSSSEELVPDVMNFYHTWLEWDKDRALEDWLLDFDKMSLKRQKSRAALLGAVLFQACDPNKPTDLNRAKKILTILTRQDFQYIVKVYANIFVRGTKNQQGLQFKQVIEKCGYSLNQFSM